VNNIAKELDTFESVFGRIEARIGKYSILGNHDYGGYYRWNSIDEKDQNLEDLKQRHKNMGFRLLLNEAVSIEKDGQKIGLIGVENWGLPPFPQFGDLEKAQESVKNLPFQVLLSHDPTHWDEVVCPTTRIDLTLSGHTHGMQFGIGFGKHKWSPVSLKYSKWGGLYSKGKQHLYVNRGFGVIGFPGRIGMDPELTLFTLRKEI
jgi:predicted MPP superfamily phosphohydrolase